MNQQPHFYMGISALQGPSATCLIDNLGNIINLSREENRTSKRGDSRWPDASIAWSIKNAKEQGYKLKSLDQITYGYNEYPISKFLRRVQYNPKKIKEFFREAMMPKMEIPFSINIPYHKSLAWAGCATSPWSESYYLIIDSIGERVTTSWGKFDSTNGIKELGKIKYPHSLGVLYSGLTRWLGLKPNEQENLVMMGAALGQPKYYDDLLKYIEFRPDGTFRITKNIHFGLEEHMGMMVPLHDWYDWCASVQAVMEQAVINLFTMMNRKYGKVKIVYGGMLANNAMINTHIMDSDLVEDLWILPDVEKVGSSIGAAAYSAALTKVLWKGPYLGADMDTGSMPSTQLLKEVVRRLESGNVVGWIQGREEMSPVNLGNRCLLIDPTSKSAKSKLDKIVRNNPYNVHDAIVIAEESWMYFDGPKMNPYKQFMVRVRDPIKYPGYSHENAMTRVQTIPKSVSPLRRLLDNWKSLTGMATLASADFRIDSESLISERKEAMKFLMNTPELDCIVIGNHFYDREYKPGLDEGQEWIVNHKDYSGGADNMIQGRF